MAAPATTVRGTPAGRKLDEGFSTKIAFSRLATVSFWEKTVQPPGVDGGEPVETTTMHNLVWHTQNPRVLLTLTPHTTKVAYDPNVYNQIVNTLVNAKGSVTVRYPDGSTLDYFGYLQKFEPDQIEEGKQPEATITIVPTNFDPVNNVEAAPVLTSVAGT